MLCLSGDLTKQTEVDLFQAEFPEWFIQGGMAEANMMSMAGALARCGYLPFVHTFGAFASRWDRDMLGLSRGSGVGPSSVTCDTLPFGEVAVRGGEHVHATDGDIGQVQGLVMDPGSRQVTHVLLQEGHVFGRKVVAIPFGAVTAVNASSIQLDITKQQVKDLPSGWRWSSW